jgi:hypothetical protein
MTHRLPGPSLPGTEMQNSKLRKMADEVDARACLSAMARSGKTLSEWARSKQLDGRSLRAWQINLSNRTATKAPTKRARLVELVPASTPGVAARYVIRVHDNSIEVGDDFDAGTLKRIVEALRAC